jgi:hypothetical protein
LVGAHSLADAPVRYTGAEGDGAGSALAGGDVNGDGVADLVVGARTAMQGQGVVYVLHGPLSGGTLANADATLSDPNVRDLGWSVAVIPDLDGEGNAEILVGAPASRDHAGEAWWLPGTLAGSVGGGESIARFVGDEHAEAGVRVGDSGAGWFVSAWLDPAAGAQAGAVYFLGVQAGSLGPGDAQATRRGEAESDWAAYGAAMDDINGDGVFDLLVGADGNDRAATDAGAAYFEYGPIEGHRSLTGAPTVLTGLAERDFAGHAVALAGDVFGTGRGSVVVGALGPGETDREGAVYAFDEPPAGESSLTIADALVAGPRGDTIFGYSLASVGDIDKDGFADLLVGARYDNTGGAHAGAAWLLYGPLDGSLSLEESARFAGEAADDDAAYNLGGADDVTGDGTPDLLFGAMGSDAGGTGAGAVYVWPAIPVDARNEI